MKIECECITKQEAIDYIKEHDGLYGANYPASVVKFLKERLNITQEELE